MIERLLKLSLLPRWLGGQPRFGEIAYFASQADVPAELPRGVMAAVGGAAADPKWAVFECPCGGRHRVMLPLRGPRSAWALTLDRAGRPSLHPSVDIVERDVRCHFWVRGGRVTWAPSRRAGRRADV